MVKLLAIDTSSSVCTVALMSADQLCVRTNTAARQAAQHILPMISEVLAESDCPMSQLDAIAVMAGPGSFTGIRIGIGVAQGLAMANSTPVLSLSSLAVKALAAHRLSNKPLQLVCEAARDEELYFACYRHSPKFGVELLGQEQVATPDALILPEAVRSAPHDCIAVGSGWNDCPTLPNSLGLRLTEPAIDPEFEISDVCELAQLRFAQGEATVAELATPNYVKERLHYSR